MLIYNNGALTVSGNAFVNLTASTLGVYANIAIYQAGADASAITVSGNANLDLNGGVLYAANPQCLATFSGNAAEEAVLVVGELTLSGNGAVISGQPGGAVLSEQIDDGTAQRSMVRSLTLTFAQTITASEIPAILAEMSLTRVSDGLSVGLAATLVNSTQLLVTFTGSSIIGGSLADGRYTLVYGGTTVLNGTQLWRLFGDLYGTGSVTTADVTAFGLANNSRKGMGNYSAYFDYQADGLIVNTDQTAFGLRKGMMLNASGMVVPIS